MVSGVLTQHSLSVIADLIRDPLQSFCNTDYAEVRGHGSRVRPGTTSQKPFGMALFLIIST